MRESATLSWSTTYANNIQIDQGIGVVSANGSVVVSPTDTMTYTISASGSGGSVTAQTTVTVVEIPQVGLVVSDNEIDYGDSVSLSWSADGYNSVFINDGDSVIEELPSGMRVFTPEHTTTYSLSASNTNGPIYITASVRVVGHTTRP